jgi:SAM-dependent methyltransferase
MGTVSGFSPNLRPELVFNSMNLRAVRDGRLTLRNRDSNRTLVFLDDLWALVQRLVFSEQTSGIYNVGSLSFKMSELAEGIASAWNAEIVDEGNSPTYSFLLDTTKMNAVCGDLLGTMTLEQRCRRFIDDCRKANLYPVSSFPSNSVLMLRLTGVLRSVLDLGMQPPANYYASSEDETVPTFPLELKVCERCWHAQLSFCVDRHQLFDHYAYASGTSGTLKPLFQLVRVAAADSFCQNRLVCSSWLPMTAASLTRCKNSGSIASASTRRETLSSEHRREICRLSTATGRRVPTDIEGEFDAIICMNVVAHVDNPRAFLGACRRKLKRGGIIIVQNFTGANVWEPRIWNTCYHEHLSFFNTSSMRVLAASRICRWQEVRWLEFTAIAQYIFSRESSDCVGESVRRAFGQGEFALMEELEDYEKDIRLYKWSTYEEFHTHAHSTIKSLKDSVLRYRAQGYKIVFVGAGRKGYDRD